MPRGSAKGRAASEGQCEGARCISWRLLLLRRRRSVSASSLRVGKGKGGAAPNRLRGRRQELLQAACFLFRRRPDQSSRVPCCMRGDWPRRRSLWRDLGQLKVAKVSASAMTCRKIGRFMRRGHCTMECLGCHAVCTVAAGVSGALCAPSTGPRGARRPLTLTRTPGSPISRNSIAIPRRERRPSG